jgi:hypothetical protein
MSKEEDTAYRDESLRLLREIRVELGKMGKLGHQVLEELSIQNQSTPPEAVMSAPVFSAGACGCDRPSLQGRNFLEWCPEHPSMVRRVVSLKPQEDDEEKDPEDDPDKRPYYLSHNGALVFVCECSRKIEPGDPLVWCTEHEGMVCSAISLKRQNEDDEKSSDYAVGKLCGCNEGHLAPVGDPLFWCHHHKGYLSRAPVNDS